jgi:hypothetical protein
LKTSFTEVAISGPIPSPGNNVAVIVFRASEEKDLSLVRRCDVVVAAAAAGVAARDLLQDEEDDLDCK